jgi:predicted DNA-binding WGR domain protein
MAIRLKNSSAVQKLFGTTGGFGAFANNEIIKNNPQLLSILSSKVTRISFKKKYYLDPKLLKVKTCNNTNKAAKLTVAKTQKEAREVNTKTHTILNVSNGVLVEQRADNISNANINTTVGTNCSAIEKQGFKEYQWRLYEKERYYNVYLQPTLLGNYSLTKSWGGLYNHLGNHKTVFFDRLEDVLLEIDKIAKQRKYKGYVESLAN